MPGLSEGISGFSDIMERGRANRSRLKTEEQAREQSEQLFPGLLERQGEGGLLNKGLTAETEGIEARTAETIGRETRAEALQDLKKDEAENITKAAKLKLDIAQRELTEFDSPQQKAIRESSALALDAQNKATIAQLADQKRRRAAGVLAFTPPGSIRPGTPHFNDFVQTYEDMFDDRIKRGTVKEDDQGNVTFETESGRQETVTAEERVLARNNEGASRTGGTTEVGGKRYYYDAEGKLQSYSIKASKEIKKRLKESEDKFFKTFNSPEIKAQFEQIALKFPAGEGGEGGRIVSDAKSRIETMRRVARAAMKAEFGEAGNELFMLIPPRQMIQGVINQMPLIPDDYFSLKKEEQEEIMDKFGEKVEKHFKSLTGIGDAEGTFEDALELIEKHGLRFQDIDDAATEQVRKEINPKVSESLLAIPRTARKAVGKKRLEEEQKRPLTILASGVGSPMATTAVDLMADSKRSAHNAHEMMKVYLGEKDYKDAKFVGERAAEARRFLLKVLKRQDQKESRLKTDKKLANESFDRLQKTINGGEDAMLSAMQELFGGEQ